MVTFREMQVQEIVEDESLTTEEKIAKLRDIESEARGLQRAASESPMTMAGRTNCVRSELRWISLARKSPRRAQRRYSVTSLGRRYSQTIRARLPGSLTFLQASGFAGPADSKGGLLDTLVTRLAGIPGVLLRAADCLGICGATGKTSLSSCN